MGLNSLPPPTLSIPRDRAWSLDSLAVPSDTVVRIGPDLNEAEVARVAEWMNSLGLDRLEVQGDYAGSITDLRCLEGFSLRSLCIGSVMNGLRSLDGLHFVGSTLHELSIASFRGTIDLVSLMAQCPDLRHLAISAKSSARSPLEHARLESISMNGPSARLAGSFGGVGSLIDVSVVGGTLRLGDLPLDRLQHLALSRVKVEGGWLSLGDFTALRVLELDHLPTLTEFPPISELDDLAIISAGTLSNLVNLESLLGSPSLRELLLGYCPVLPAAQVNQLRAHPTLRRLAVGLRNRTEMSAIAETMQAFAPPTPASPWSTWRDWLSAD